MSKYTKQVNAEKTLGSFVFAGQILVWLALLVFSGHSVGAEALKVGLPEYIVFTAPIMMDLNLIVMFFTIKSKMSEGKKVHWHITYTLSTMIVITFLILDKWIGLVENSTFTTAVILGYIIPSLFITAIFKVDEIASKTKEKSKPTKDKVYEYWLENEIQNGKKVTGSQMKVMFGVEVGTFNLWRREWRKELDQESGQESFGTTRLNGSKTPVMSE